MEEWTAAGDRKAAVLFANRSNTLPTPLMFAGLDRPKVRRRHMANPRIRTMRMFSLNKILAACIACCVLAGPLAATADTRLASSYNPGSSCQLSIPTTDTSVRAKASGFRNESTSVSNFVICPIHTPITTDYGPFISLYVHVEPIGFIEREVSCTAVVGLTSGSLQYSTKTYTFAHGGFNVYWQASDFNGTAEDPINYSDISTITCLLPPQSLILFSGGNYYYDIGT